MGCVAFAHETLRLLEQGSPSQLLNGVDRPTWSESSAVLPRNLRAAPAPDRPRCRWPRRARAALSPRQRRHRSATRPQAAVAGLDVRRAVRAEYRAVLEVGHDVQLRFQRGTERLEDRGQSPRVAAATGRRPPEFVGPVRQMMGRKRRGSSGACARDCLGESDSSHGSASATPAPHSTRRRVKARIMAMAPPSSPPRRDRKACVETSASISRPMLGVCPGSSHSPRACSR